MKPLVDRRFVIAVLTIACLATVLLTVAPIRSGSPSAGEYDPWLDWNDDSKIDLKDVSRVARAFGTNGTNVSKASIEYESDWMNITDKCGQNIIITHGLNSTDLIVDIQGKTTPDSGPHQKHYGLAGCIQGWSKTYGGTGKDYAEALVQTSDGGYTIAGYTNSFGAGLWDFWLVKTDANGKMQWNMTYGGTSYDGAYALVQTSDGGYAIAGYSDSFGAGEYDFWLVKTDSNGNAQWNKTYGGTASTDWAYALVQTSDGGYALAGVTQVWGVSNGDFWLVKTDADGNAQWNKTYGTADHDLALALVQTADGGYALAGPAYIIGRHYDFWLVKTDATGHMQWSQTYGGTENEEAWALVQTADGGYTIAGWTTSFGAGNADSWLVRTDAYGNMMWNGTYGGTGDDFAYDLVQTTDGGYALAGFTMSPAGSRDFWLGKTDANGNMMWSKTYGGIGDDLALASVQTGDWGYALTGYTESFGAGCDFWLVKTDASGNTGGVESGLAWIDSSADTITLCRGATDPYWNYVRVRLWKPHETP